MRIVLFFLGLFLAEMCVAQIDPSSALLLNGSSGASRKSRDSSDSSRYEVRPRESSSGRSSGRRSGSTNDSEVMLNPPTRPSPPPPTNTTPAEEYPLLGSSPTPTPAPQTVTPPDTSFEPVPENSQPVADISPKGIPLELDYQRVKNDQMFNRRFNILELSIAPAYFYNSSDSTSWYRKYSSSGPALSLSGNVWIAPNLGLGANYFATFGGTVSNSTDGASTVTANQEIFQVGFRFRRFFSEAAQSPSMTFSLDYEEYNFRVPADANRRLRLKTFGPRVAVDMDFPTSSSYSWTAGFAATIKGKHAESTTGQDVGSGSNGDTNSVAVHLGGRMGFDRTSSLFWKLSERVEKNVFSGTAAAADPISGSTPSGVPVTNSFTILEFGYTWGN